MAEKTDQMGWGEVDNDEVTEDVDAKAVEDCEKGSSMPWGKHIVTVVDSVPKEAHLKAYTCIGANLKMQIEKTLEIEGVVTTDENSAEFEDRYIFDDILLFNEDEKPGMKNRRILIAKRLGLVSESGGKISKKAWSEDILNKRFVVITEKNEYTDKAGKEVIGQPKVAFAGYETVDTGSEERSDGYDDI